MSEKPFVFEPINNMQEATALIGRLFDAALPEAVFSDPVSHGEYTVITPRKLPSVWAPASVPAAALKGMRQQRPVKENNRRWDTATAAAAAAPLSPDR